MGNHLAQHPDLSLVAIGIGVHVQSLPDGAHVGIKDLTRRFREGEVTIARALRELERAGYLERRRVRTEGGQVVSVTRWYERPGALNSARVAAARVVAPVAPVVRAAAPAPEPAPAPTPTPVDLEKRWLRAEEKPQTPHIPPPRAPKSPHADAEEPTSTPAAPDQPAADLLAALRRHDPRLLLSEKDVVRLAPAVRAWLDRGVGPVQVTRTLTADLPVGHIAWPARLLQYRLTHWLPPALPTGPAGLLGPPTPSAAGAEPARPAAPRPLRTCDGCERAFRPAGSSTGNLCRDCREAQGIRDDGAQSTPLPHGQMTA
ncbi:hypothetical protein [Streptomyces sp. I05A-00742]|uniref:hypothetical protein n=1 Tax=Streptomyces sp. I05A-00742 TaxID=2732853 RepID=UPI001BB1BC85|nr:hypothetical protein [Streptomyces sp. I05A-00742]